MAERKANHQINKVHKRALASARRAISKAIDKVGLVYNTDLGGETGYDEDMWQSLNKLQEIQNLILRYAEKRYGITRETLDRY